MAKTLDRSQFLQTTTAFDAELFWRRDHHLDVAGHLLAAELFAGARAPLSGLVPHGLLCTGVTVLLLRLYLG